jgi:hypothetical protein
MNDGEPGSLRTPRLRLPLAEITSDFGANFQSNVAVPALLAWAMVLLGIAGQPNGRA